MKKNLRKYHKALVRTRGIIFENPVLMGGLALPAVVVATTSLKNAVALSIAIAVTTIPLMLVAATVGKKIPLNLRVVSYVLLASALLCGASYQVGKLSPNIFDSLGIYYSLMAVNTIMLTRTESIRDKTVLEALLDGVSNSIGFALVVCAIGAIREFFGSGSLWGIPIQMHIAVPSALLPFFGFLLLGFFCAAARFVGHFIKARLLVKNSRAAQ